MNQIATHILNLVVGAIVVICGLVVCVTIIINFDLIVSWQILTVVSFLVGSYLIGNVIVTSISDKLKLMGQKPR